jgi:hypothetical protein
VKGLPSFREGGAKSFDEKYCAASDIERLNAATNIPHAIPKIHAMPSSPDKENKMAARNTPILKKKIKTFDVMQSGF